MNIHAERMTSTYMAYTGLSRCPCVLVCSSCSNEVPQTGWITEISRHSEGWNSEVREPAWLGLVRVLFQVADFSLYPHMLESRELLAYKGTNSFKSLHSSPFKGPTSEYHHTGG